MKYKPCHKILFLKYEETNKHLIISLICSVYVRWARLIELDIA